MKKILALVLALALCLSCASALAAKVGVSMPTKDETRQLSVFLEGPDGLPREVVLLAAEECADAERPFGKLKAILKDWAERKVRTVAEAQKALSERAGAAYPQRSRRGRRDSFQNYAEPGVSHVNLDDIALTLDDEL